MTPTPISVQLQSPATPVTFKLQGTGELDIRSIVATWDGTSAAGAFYPVISVYTSDDRLLSRTRVQDAVSAGSSVVATFAPFLRKQAAAVTPSGSALPWAALYDGQAQKSYTYAGLATVPFNSSLIHNDSGGIFAVSGGAQAKTLTVSQTGLYLVHIQVAWEDASVAAPFRLRLLGMPNYEGENNYNRILTEITDTDDRIMEWVTSIAVSNTGLPYLFNLQAGESSGLSQWLDGNFMKVTRLSDI